MKKVTYSLSCVRALRRLNVEAAARLLVNLERYAANPALFKGQVTKLRGCDGYRLRIAERRVVFDEDDGIVAVLGISPSDDVNFERHHA